MPSTTRGSILISTANDIGTTLVSKLGGTGYTPDEWDNAANLCGIASADIETALSNIQESTPGGADRGSISIAKANSIGRILNKKFDTSRGFKPSEWASAIDKLTPLEIKTASGAIASFSDGADDVPMSSVVAHIAPTLTGKNAVNMVQIGKNLFNANATDANNGYIQYYYLLNTGETYYNSDWATSEYIAVKENLQYTLSGIIGGNPSICFYDENKTFLSGVKYGNASPKTVTTPTGAAFARVSFENSLKDVWQLEVGSSASSYEPYAEPTTYTASLGRTIYGGQADIVSGQGIDENGDDFTFDGQEIPSLLGVNNLWHDDGETEVVYRADIDLAQ